MLFVVALHLNLSGSLLEIFVVIVVCCKGYFARCSHKKVRECPHKPLLEKGDNVVESKPEFVTMNLFRDTNTLNVATGKGRFAAEQFIGSHPSLKPCSFTKPEAALKSFWKIDPPKPFERNVVPVGGRKPPLLDEIVADKNKHLVEWYLLPGILWRYHILYGEMPGADSWVWRHYPDGERWREVIEERGFPQALYHRIETETTL